MVPPFLSSDHLYRSVTQSMLWFAVLGLTYPNKCRTFSGEPTRKVRLVLSSSSSLATIQSHHCIPFFLSLSFQVTALEKLHAKHALPGFTDRTAEEREIEATTTDITKVRTSHCLGSNPSIYPPPCSGFPAHYIPFPGLPSMPEAHPADRLGPSPRLPPIRFSFCARTP